MAGALTDAFEMAAQTDTGMRRVHNEDAVFANPKLGLAILADGMGGCNAGEVASGLATLLLSTGLEAALLKEFAQENHERSGKSFTHDCVLKNIEAANKAIWCAAQNQAQYAGMGTTLVTALFYNNKVTVAHLGDSRLYRLRGDEFSALTHDHSLLQEMLDEGTITREEARFSDSKNLVTRALCAQAEAHAEIYDYPVLPGDLYLLCSDGLTDCVEDWEIREGLLVLQASGDGLAHAAQKLIRMSNEKGGRDNVSVILIRVLCAFTSDRSPRC